MRTPLAAAILAALGVWTAAAGSGLETGGLTALPEFEVGPDLLRNGGFEAAPGAAPAGWQLRGGWSLTGESREGRHGLRLAGADASEQASAVEQTVMLERGFHDLEAWVRTAGLGEGERRSGVRLCLDGRPRVQAWHCTAIVGGTTNDWSQVRLRQAPVLAPGPWRVVIAAYGRPAGAAWVDGVRLTRVSLPLEVFLLYPNFRGLLFDDGPQAVRVALRAEGARGQGRIRLRLTDEAGGTEHARAEVPDDAAEAELDAGRLDRGAYRLQAELVDAAGAVRARYPDHRVVKVPAAARAGFNVWYDARNVTHLGGRPAFVLGLYTTSGYASSRRDYARGGDGWGTARIAEAPIDMLINYRLGAAPIPALQTYLDDLHGRGIRYLQTVNFHFADDRAYGTIPYAAARQGEMALGRWVARTLGVHPGLAGFYTADERPADMVPKVFRQRQALMEGAPGTVTYAVLGNGHQHQAPLWRDAVDVIGLDPYPISRPRGQNDLALVSEWTRIGREAVHGARPVWMVIQYFPQTRAAGWPTYEELRAMSWLAIVEGAQGLFYWSFGARGLAWVKDPAEREARWRDLFRVTREIKALEPALLARDTPLVAREASGGRVRTLGKRLPDGTRYLFACNATGQPARVTWTLAEQAREVVELGGGRALEAGLTIEAELPPWGVRQYRIR